MCECEITSVYERVCEVCRRKSSSCNINREAECWVPKNMFNATAMVTSPGPYEQTEVVTQRAFFLICSSFYIFF